MDNRTYQLLVKELDIVSNKHKFIEGVQYAAQAAFVTGLLTLIGIYKSLFPEAGNVLPTEGGFETQRIIIANLIPIIGMVWGSIMFIARYELIRKVKLLVEYAAELERKLLLVDGLFIKMENTTEIYISSYTWNVIIHMTVIFGWFVLWSVMG